MKGKICVVTGATAGIGNALVKKLACKGATLAVICRDRKKGERLLDELATLSHCKDHALILADLSSLNDTKKSAVEIMRQFHKVDVLVNNAGVFHTSLCFTVDHIEMQFAVNVLAPYYLTNLLSPHLKLSSSARVINTSSISHYFGKMHFDDLYFTAGYDGFAAYNQAKLAVHLLTTAFARRVKSSITVNSCSPGRVNTNIGNTNATGFWKYAWILNKPLLISVEKGARTPDWLATSPDASPYNGKYIYKNRPLRPSRRAGSVIDSERLWKVCAGLTGIDNFTV